MPSTFTSSLRLTLPATGENAGTWGNLVNTGITTLIDTSIAGTASITVAGTDYTLTNNNGTTDEARAMVINATGTPGAARNVICPAASKMYVFRNNTTGGFAMTLKTSGGSGIAVPAGQSRLLYCDGTNVVEAVNAFSSLTLGTALGVASGGTGITSLGANIPTFLQTPSSANLAAAVTDETGSGALVFANSPTLGAFNATGNVNLDGGTFVFNDSAADKDARFEGVSDANLIYMDASTNRVGFGTDTPAGRIHILGTGLTSSTLEMESTSSSASRPSIVNFTRSTTTGTTQLWITNILSRFYNTSSVLTSGSQISSFANNNAGSESCYLQLGALSNVRFGDLSIERARFDSVTGNCKIGGTASRSTTEGTYQLVLFDGTAPSGTLTNGVSFYSSSGEARVMDAAGNSTLLSPHDHETNEWIFHSKHTPTGKVLRIDVERLLKFVNDHFGLDAVQEFIEE